MTQDGNHLSVEQIECLVESLFGLAATDEQSELVRASHRHLANCEECQRLLSMHKEFDQALGQLKEHAPNHLSTDCLSNWVLSELAAGISNAEKTDNLLSHISQCDRCGPLFKEAFENFQTEETPDEALAIGLLKSSAPEWQRKMAGRLASDAGKSGAESPDAIRPIQNTRQFSTAGWLYALAAMVILMLLTLGGREIWFSRVSYVQGLLGHAYSERRNMEVRISGGGYGPLRFGRGTRVSGDRPGALSEAEKRIRIELARHPRSIPWQQARVRQELLEGDYDSAVRVAELAVAEGPPSPSLLNDLACAYFQKAEHEDTASAVEYGKAYEALSKSLAMSLDDPLTLFNRAIVSQRLELYSQAEADLERYLVLDSDPNSEWRVEASSKLKDVKDVLKKQKSQSDKTLKDPKEIASNLSSGDAEQISKVDSRADFYQKIVVETWLPEIANDRAMDREARNSLERAVALLAEDFRVRHNDLWLTDFLSVRFSPNSSAVESLGKALKASSNGEQEKAIQLAKVAEHQFEGERNEPGRVRAALEWIYANHLAAHGEVCHRGAVALLDVLRGRNYIWIETQTQLEAAACAQQVSRIDESIARARQALEMARAGKYGNLELRATMFAVDPLPDPIQRANSLIEALSTYWRGTYEPMRGYSLYASMDYTSGEDLQMWYLNEAVIREGLGLLEGDPDLALRGLETYRLAHAQIIVGETEQANRTVDEARRLLAQSDSPALSAGAAVDLAEALVINGRQREALDLLGYAESYLQNLSHDIVVSKFYSVRAGALLGVGQSFEAEQSFLQALQLAHKALRGISDERDRYSWAKTLAVGYRSIVYIELQKDPAAAFRLWESFKGDSVLDASGTSEESFSIATLEAHPPTVNDWADGRTLLLSYASFPEGVAVWGYDGKQIENLWVPNVNSRMDLLGRHFYEGCADPSSDPETLHLEGRELYDLLIKPASGWLKGRSRLIIESDASIASIPFEALVDEAGKYLVESYEIAYSTGIAHLNGDRTLRRIDRRSRALVVGQSLGDAEEELPRLPGASEEARDVASRFDDAVLLIDTDASLSRVVQELDRAEVFHFAGHALGTRQRNGLLLANSNNDQSARFLNAQNFNTKLFAHSRLVVLSACSTANGTGTDVEDRESLARNILAAGVPSVVASRWVVDSVATREWMKSFYDELVRNGTVSSAAGQTKLTMQRNPKWKHPFYWASFSVFV